MAAFLFLSGFQRPGCQGRNLLVGAAWKTLEEFFEIGVGFEAVMTAVLDDGVEHGTTPAGFGRTNKQEVLFTKGVGDGLPKEAFGKVLSTCLESQKDSIIFRGCPNPNLPSSGRSRMRCSSRLRSVTPVSDRCTSSLRTVPDLSLDTLTRLRSRLNSSFTFVRLSALRREADHDGPHQSSAYFSLPGTM